MNKKDNLTFRVNIKHELMPELYDLLLNSDSYGKKVLALANKQAILSQVKTQDDVTINENERTVSNKEGSESDLDKGNLKKDAVSNTIEGDVDIDHDLAPMPKGVFDDLLVTRDN